MSKSRALKILRSIMLAGSIGLVAGLTYYATMSILFGIALTPRPGLFNGDRVYLIGLGLIKITLVSGVYGLVRGVMQKERNL